jgi:hypothetical protein
MNELRQRLNSAILFISTISASSRDGAPLVVMYAERSSRRRRSGSVRDRGTLHARLLHSIPKLSTTARRLGVIPASSRVRSPFRAGASSMTVAPSAWIAVRRKNRRLFALPGGRAVQCWLRDGNPVEGGSSDVC